MVMQYGIPDTQSEAKERLAYLRANQQSRINENTTEEQRAKIIALNPNKVLIACYAGAFRSHKTRKILEGRGYTASNIGVNRNRLIISLSISTFLIAIISYYLTAIGLNIITANQILDIIVTFMGPVSGVVAGYAAAFLWNKYLRNIKIEI